MRYYFDESGSITLSDYKKNRFFVIASLTTNNPEKVKRVFRKSKVNYLKYNDVGLDIKSEIKGSEMSFEFKEYIFKQLISKTDIQFNFLVFDNMNATENLRNKPTITFNYLMYLKTAKLITSHEKLFLDLDNRNNGVKNLKSLEEYLQTKHCIETDSVTDVSVNYFDSSKNTLIQIADVFANFIFRMMKCKSNHRDYSLYSDLLDLIKESSLQHCQYFPKHACDCKNIFRF